MRTAVLNTKLSPAQERTLRAFPKPIGWVDSLEWCRALGAPLRAPTVKCLVGSGMIVKRYPDSASGSHVHQEYRMAQFGIDWLRAKDAGKL